MNLPVCYENEKFEPVYNYIHQAQQEFGASASSVMVIQNDRIVFERYHGFHHHKKGALAASDQSQFNIYSTRKTYVCLAMAMAALENNIDLSTPVYKIINELGKIELGEITLCDLATATGPKYFGKEQFEREGVQGFVVKALTGKVISQYLREKILNPLEMKGTEWASIPHQNLVSDYTTSDNFAMVRLESTDRHERLRKS